MLVIIIIFAILMVLGIMVISVYNKCIFYRDRVLDKFSAVDKLIDERIKFINDIIKVINDNNLHEEKIVRNLNKYKKLINEEESINDRLLLLDDESIAEALKLDSVYKKLVKDKVFNDVKEKYDNNKGKATYAIDIYNKEVFEYNNYKNSKFNNMVFSFFKFMEYNYYDK